MRESADSPAPQASGWVSAKHKLRSSRKAPSENNSFPWLPLAPSASPSFHPLTGRIQKIWYLSAKNMVSFNKKYGIFHSSPAHTPKRRPPVRRTCPIRPNENISPLPHTLSLNGIYTIPMSLCKQILCHWDIGKIQRIFFHWVAISFPRRTFPKSPAGHSPIPPQDFP